MKNSIRPWQRSLLLFVVTLGVVSSTLAFAVLQGEDVDDRVSFSLDGSHGQQVSQDDFRGDWLLVHFGYTNCPDVCPTMLSKLRLVMRELDAAGLSQRVRPVFISVDPDRDNVEMLKGYLKFFDERIIGLTGTQTAIDSAAASFDTFAQAESPKADGTYDVVHSGLLYVVDPYGRRVAHIPLAANVQSTVATISDTIL